MTIPMAEGQQIYVAHKRLPGSYCMPSMKMATSSYNMGYVISGDRLTVTPMQAYSYHAGDVALMPPYLYHRTLSESDAPYESYFIKFTPLFIQPFLDHIGHPMLDDLFEQKVCCFNKNSQEKIKRMFSEMVEEYQKESSYKEFILQGMLFRLITTIWEERQLPPDTVAGKSPLTGAVIDAICHIETHYASDLTLKKTAKAVNLSPSYLSRLFRAQLGMTFSTYLSNVKMKHVKFLLSRTDKSVMDIALETGFCSGEYLSAQFKSKLGMTPTEFRKSASITYSSYMDSERS